MGSCLRRIRLLGSMHINSFLLLYQDVYIFSSTREFELILCARSTVLILLLYFFSKFFYQVLRRRSPFYVAISFLIAS